jgi:hypothetical protein
MTTRAIPEGWIIISDGEWFMPTLVENIDAALFYMNTMSDNAKHYILHKKLDSAVKECWDKYDERVRDEQS